MTFLASQALFSKSLPPEGAARAGPDLFYTSDEQSVDLEIVYTSDHKHVDLKIVYTSDGKSVAP